MGNLTRQRLPCTQLTTLNGTVETLKIRMAALQSVARVPDSETGVPGGSRAVSAELAQELADSYATLHNRLADLEKKAPARKEQVLDESDLKADKLLVDVRAHLSDLQQRVQELEGRPEKSTVSGRVLLLLLFHLCAVPDSPSRLCTAHQTCTPLCAKRLLGARAASRALAARVD